jgi:hypothetical protein
MTPTLLLVCDPRLQRAQADLATMLDAVGATGDPSVLQTGGADWVAAVIPPPGHELTAGAAICSEGGDVLLWAGEMFLPRDWQVPGALPRPQDAIAAAVLHRIQRHGLEQLLFVDGAFCGAWYCRERRCWTVFNDKMGLIPLFWSAQDERFVVSTRAWVTWRGSRAPLQISTAGVCDLIRTQNMVEDHTLIEGVFWLSRGHALTWGEEGAACRRYWDFDYRQPQIEDEAIAIDRYLESIDSSMRRHADCDGPLMLGISGGLDSRIFLAVCERLGRVPDCFTAGWPFYEDVRFGRKLAHLAGASHEIAPLEGQRLPDLLAEAIKDTDGLQSAAHLAAAAVARDYLRQHHGAVLLEGFFHGLVGGCSVPAEDDVPLRPASDSGHCGVLMRPPAHATRWARGMLHAGGDFEFVNDLLQPELARESLHAWRARIDEGYRTAPVDDPLHRVEYTVVSGRKGRIDVLGTGLLRGEVLLRNPSADASMLAWHQQTSPRLRRGRALYLEVLRRRFPRYAAVPRADNCGGLPIAGGRWAREYYWQREKLYRWYLRRRYPWTRRFGAGSKAIRAWVFETWRQSGALDVLTEPDARVLNWVRREPLMRLWELGVNDPLKAEPLLTLATLEMTVRRLERLATVRLEPEADRRSRSLIEASRRSPVGCGTPVSAA